jgi:hypothetical protein
MFKKFFKDMPVTRIIILSAALFIFEAVMSMYYNNNSIIFPDIEAFNSFNRAEALSNMDMSGGIRDLPAKRWSNGSLYTFILAPLHKIAGKSNVIVIVYIFDLAIFAFILFAFYKVAADLSGKETALISMFLFGLSPPIVLGVFSGADVAVTMLLFAGAFYHAYFSLPSKKYTGFMVFSLLLLLNGFVPAVFGLAFLAYGSIKFFEKKNRRNHQIAMWGTLAAFAVVASIILAYVFIENFTAEYMKNNGLLDVKTWTVDAFFKDGFLWSKYAPSFFVLFFYISFFIKISAELKDKTAGIMTLTMFLATAALLAGFFSNFAPPSRSYLFTSPFFFCLFLVGINGLMDFSKYMEMKKTVNFSAANIFYGFMIFMIIFNIILCFNRTVEADNMIQYITGDSSVSKYLER